MVRWTYRWCTWWAQQHGIPFRFPQARPVQSDFVSATRTRCELLFTGDPYDIPRDRLWTTGADAASSQLDHRVGRSTECGRGNSLERLTIKDALKQETNQAIENGVFGVPTLCRRTDSHSGTPIQPILSTLISRIAPCLIRRRCAESAHCRSEYHARFRGEIVDDQFWRVEQRSCIRPSASPAASATCDSRTRSLALVRRS